MEPMPAQKLRWDESSSGDSAAEWKYVMPRKKQARKTETATAQDGKNPSKPGGERVLSPSYAPESHIEPSEGL